MIRPEYVYTIRNHNHVYEFERQSQIIVYRNVTYSMYTFRTYIIPPYTNTEWNFVYFHFHIYDRSICRIT